MLFRFGCVGVLAALSCPVASCAAEPVKSAADLERVRALVETGALPQKALTEAAHDLERSRFEEVLRKTLPKQELTEPELAGMIEAATRLRDLAREQLALTRSRVEAGALPIKKLEADKAQAEFAERQYELAEKRAKLVRELAEMARAEARLDELQQEELAFVSDGGDPNWDDDVHAVEAAYFEAFGSPLPISADGDTELHESLGFDHTGRLDVAVDPDGTEGMFLIELLETWDMPYIAFRSAVPGQSTGPHIHIGPRSDRIPAVQAQ